MNKLVVERMHNELSAAIKPILEKYGLNLQPSTLTHNIDSISLPIKGTRAVTITTALTATTETLRNGFARIGTKAVVFDSRNMRSYRNVIITEVKRKKYGFYYLDDPQKRPMIGHFELFSSVN